MANTLPLYVSILGMELGIYWGHRTPHNKYQETTVIPKCPVLN
jgi:hypothetical protein